MPNAKTVRKESRPAPTMGQRIASARVLRGWNQGDLAERADISTTALSMIETGNAEPKLATIMKIARALEVSLDELTGFERQSAA